MRCTCTYTRKSLGQGQGLLVSLIWLNMCASRPYSGTEMDKTFEEKICIRAGKVRFNIQVMVRETCQGGQTFELDNPIAESDI